MGVVDGGVDGWVDGGGREKVGGHVLRIPFLNEKRKLSTKILRFFFRGDELSFGLHAKGVEI